MEKHIFKFGESSLALIVPKRWIEKHGLKPSSTIDLAETETGDLVISVGKVAQRQAEKTINQKISPFIVGRWVGLHYMYGTSKITLYSKEGFTQAQLDGIEEKIDRECPGFEITNQSNSEIVIEDFTNIKEVNIEKIVMRVRSLIEQEFREIREGNPKTIPKIERLVNRFYMLGIRYLNIMQAKEYLRQLKMLEFMELISDGLDGLSNTNAVKSKAIFAELEEQFRLCLPAFKGDQKAIEEIANRRNQLVKRLARAKLDKFDMHMLVHLADNIANISEFGLTVEKKEEFTIPIEINE